MIEQKQKLYIIKQISMKNDIYGNPIKDKYRGKGPKSKNKNSKLEYGELKEKIKEVEPFVGEEGIAIINDLFFAMENNLIFGNNLNNADKYYVIYEVDEKYNILNEYPLMVFLNKFGYHDKYDKILAVSRIKQLNKINKNNNVNKGN